MSLIVWRPILDEVDDARYPYTDLFDGWHLIEAWCGRDIYDQEPIYTLELVHGDGTQGSERPERRAILWRFESVQNLDALRNPKPLTEDNVADAAGISGSSFSGPSSFARSVTLCG